jgi:hypothetical protein
MFCVIAILSLDEFMRIIFPEKNSSHPLETPKSVPISFKRTNKGPRRMTVRS